jgi:hypothetical protein
MPRQMLVAITRILQGCMNTPNREIDPNRRHVTMRPPLSTLYCCPEPAGSALFGSLESPILAIWKRQSLFVKYGPRYTQPAVASRTAVPAAFAASSKA